MKLNKIYGIILAVVAVLILSMASSIGEDVKNDEIVLNQYPFTGKIAVWTEPGFKWQWFGKLTRFKKTYNVDFTEYTIDENGEISIVGCKNPAFPIRYADKGKGYIVGIVRVELPTNPEMLKVIQATFSNEDRLIEELIRTNVGKVVLASGPLLTSLESVAERRNDVTTYITDQLDNGVYKTRVKTVEKLNSITNEMEKIQQAEVIEDENGNIKRVETAPFAAYGIKIANNVAIKDFLYEKATNSQIAKQREADMNIITAKSEAAQAIQQTIKIEEEGKQSAAASRWEQEAIKAAEVTKAQQEYEVARLQALKAKEEAKKIAAEGEAKALANRLLVQAGLDPKTKAEIEKETAIGVAKALAESQVKWVPDVVVIGDKNGDSTDPMKAFGINMLLDIARKQSQNK